MSKRAKRKQRAQETPAKVQAISVPPAAAKAVSAQEAAQDGAVLADISRAIVGMSDIAQTVKLALRGATPASEGDRIVEPLVMPPGGRTNPANIILDLLTDPFYKPFTPMPHEIVLDPSFAAAAKTLEEEVPAARLPMEVHGPIEMNFKTTPEGYVELVRMVPRGTVPMPQHALPFDPREEKQ